VSSANAADASADAAEVARIAAVAAQVAAESALANTLSAYDNFDDRYLGSKTSAPTLDNDGNALIAGTLYYQSTGSTGMKIYTGSAWVDAYVDGTGVVLKANNLSDLTNAATARTNLGAGATGSTLFTAASAPAARSTLGATTIGGNIFTAADAAAVRALLTTPTPLGVALSDETTDLTTGTGKITFRMPGAFTLTDIRINVNTAPTGSTIIVNVKKNGTTIFGANKLSIDASEKTSVTAATAANISTTAFASDDEITIDIDQVGSTIKGKGLKLWMIGYYT
jgi:hypothetical protein